eukprot:gb/GEZN01015935.1/.p3 GENE.gb/GEZN01015935.1/~~gb/GEZN01015935.1/.p3  ORF type:complete len:113 (-),score=38.45 gb/GEZN01015935.1/:106-444(-)
MGQPRIAAYLLVVVSGSKPDKKLIEAILGSVAIKADGAEIDAVLKELDGKDLDKLLEDGLAKLGTVTGGMGGGGGGGGGAAAGGAAEKEKEKEKEESSEEESEADMGFSLFD